jgi:hypothetical protein
MFKCKCCPEKDARIQDLKSEITRLWNMVNPAPRVQVYEAEQDYILDGANQEQTELPIQRAVNEEQAKELAAIESERERILNGNW